MDNELGNDDSHMSYESYTSTSSNENMKKKRREIVINATTAYSTTATVHRNQFIPMYTKQNAGPLTQIQADEPITLAGLFNCPVS